MGMKPRWRKWRWVTRNSEAHQMVVLIWDCAEQPHLVYGHWHTKSCMSQRVTVCVDEFKDLFGVVPEPGECMKVRFYPAAMLEVFCE